MSTEVAQHLAHPLHAGGRVYTETNCYSDILVELLHARGHEPLAVLGCTLRLDFEGDQFTFFKPAPGDLELLLGIDIHEMQPHRSLPLQIAEQLARGRTLIPELDSFYLPDTAATAYRREHVKTSVAIEAIDLDARTLRYFHNAGLYELSGMDYDGVFRLDHAVGEDVLPPYVELVRFDAGPPLSGDRLRAAATVVTRGHLARRPRDNPFTRFGAQLREDLPALLAGTPAEYHAYAFATVRMAGSGFDVAGAHVGWLLGEDAQVAIDAFGRIAEASKVLSFRLARRRPFDPAETVGTMEQAWHEAMAALDDLLA